MLGIPFKQVPAHIDEHHSGFNKPHAIVKSIALRKAKSVAKKHPNDWVLGCDTIVVHKGGKITLKPKNKAVAKLTLQQYRNSYCDVYSGLALINRYLNKKFVQYAKTRLHFNNFSDADIEDYLKSTDRWKSSSGAMTIEGKAGEWIKNIEGDYWNVVGLPVQVLKNTLRSVKML